MKKIILLTIFLFSFSFFSVKAEENQNFTNKNIPNILNLIILFIIGLVSWFFFYFFNLKHKILLKKLSLGLFDICINLLIRSTGFGQSNILLSSNRSAKLKPADFAVPSPCKIDIGVASFCSLIKTFKDGTESPLFPK